MARKIFFSFHHEKDNGRIGQIRNSWVTQDREAAGFWDSAEWEEVKGKNKEDIEKWILNQLNGTSVTVVLIGEETDGRPWVNFEIKESHNQNSGMIGIYIHNVKDFRTGQTCRKGKNPFEKWYVEKNGKKIYFSEMYQTYDWVNDDGYNNLGNWVEKAAKEAGR